jgi:hypothetical protein
MKNIFNNKIFKVVFLVLKIFFICMFSLYLVINLLFFITIKSSLFGYRIFSVKTDSMSGVYDTGDVLIIKDTSYNTLKKSNDILYYTNNSLGEVNYFVSRIDSIDNDYIYTKNVDSDYLNVKIESSQIMGKVVGKSDILSILNKIYLNVFTLFFIIYLPLIIIIILDILNIVTNRIIISYTMTQKLNIEKQEDVNNNATSNSDVPEIIEVIDVLEKDTKDKDDFMIVK